MALHASGYDPLIRSWFADSPGVNQYDHTLAEDGYYITTAGNRNPIATWAWSGLIPVTAGETYTLWYNSDSGLLHPDVNFFTSAGLAGKMGNAAANAGTNLTFADNYRTLTFTVPAGAAYVSNNIMYSLTHTTDDFNARKALIQLEAGTRRTQFAAYDTQTRAVNTPAAALSAIALVAGDLDIAETAISRLEKPCKVTKDGASDFYVRSRWTGTEDIVTLMWIDTGRNGVVQPSSASIIASTTTSDTLATQHVVTANRITSTQDDPGAFRFNQRTVGSNHGHDVKTVTATGHGKTVEDVGSVWSDTAPVNWVLLEVTDANTLVFGRDYTVGGDGTYTAENTLTGSTLTHVSGATNTGSVTVGSSVSDQLYPSIRSKTLSIITDTGEELTTADDGDYETNGLWVRESYIITSYKAVVDFAKARVGGAVAPDYADASIDGLVRVEQTYKVHSAQNIELHQRVTLLDEVRVGASYILQAQVISLPSGGTRYEYIPDALAIGADDPTAGVDIGTPSPGLVITPAYWRYATAPPSRMVTVTTKSTGLPRVGLLLEIDESVGAGRPSIRAANLNAGHACELRSSSRKSYLVGYGDEVTNAASASGTVFEMLARRRYFLPSSFGTGWAFL